MTRKGQASFQSAPLPSYERLPSRATQSTVLVELARERTVTGRRTS